MRFRVWVTASLCCMQELMVIRDRFKTPELNFTLYCYVIWNSYTTRAVYAFTCFNSKGRFILLVPCSIWSGRLYNKWNRSRQSCWWHIRYWWLGIVNFCHFKVYVQRCVICTYCPSSFNLHITQTQWCCERTLHRKESTFSLRLKWNCSNQVDWRSQEVNLVPP